MRVTEVKRTFGDAWYQPGKNRQCGKILIFKEFRLLLNEINRGTTILGKG